MLDSQNRQIARSPATKEFDDKMSKMYEKVYREVSKLSRKAVAHYELNIDQILMPTSTESEDAKVAKKFTRAKLKILSSVNQLVKMLVAGRNRVSLFDMFDPNEQNGKKFAKKYNRIKMTALGRLESGVGLMKFTDMHELPLATMLFPTPNTKLYTGRYELLKHKMLTKVNKGIRNITFVAPVVHKSFKLTKIEKTRANIPIDSFLMPSANSNFYTLRYNLAKHRMLTKVNKGIKNLTFVAPTKIAAGRRLNGTTIYKPLKTKVDVPIDSFIMPVGNDPIYIARYADAKHKLLTKIKKGIASIDFTGQSFDLMDKFMPSDGVDSGDLSNTIGKALAKSINRESKAKANATKRAAKVNEFQAHKREKRLNSQFKLDQERNEILMSIFNGGYGAASGKGFSGKSTNTRYNKKTNTFSSTAMGAFAGTGTVDLIKKVPVAAWKSLGAGVLIAGAGFAGFKFGQFLDDKLNLSGGISEALSKITGYFQDKDLEKGLEHIKWIGANNQVNKSSMMTQIEFDKLGGGTGKTAAQNSAILAQANINERKRQSNISKGNREAEFDKLNGGLDLSSITGAVTTGIENATINVETKNTIIPPRANFDILYGALDKGL